jgi:hypothetical protein
MLLMIAATRFTRAVISSSLSFLMAILQRIARRASLYYKYSACHRVTVRWLYPEGPGRASQGFFFYLLNFSSTVYIFPCLALLFGRLLDLLWFFLFISLIS